MASTAPTTPALSAEDVALYDRQIRLWGLAAQQRIRSAAVVLACASAASLALHELAKNLALKGVGRITIAPLGDDSASEAFVGLAIKQRDESHADALARYVRALNPAVDAAVYRPARAESLSALVAGAAACVLVDDVPAGAPLALAPATAFAWDAACRAERVPFLWAPVFGARFALLADFGAHWAFVARGPDGADAAVPWPFAALPDVWAAHLARADAPRGRARAGRPLAFSAMLHDLQVALVAHTAPGPSSDGALADAPVRAVAGAVAAQEVVKAATGRDRPIRAALVFDGRSLESHVVHVPLE